MLGRVNPSVMKNDFLYNVKLNKEKLQNTQTHLTSGRKVNLPSDNPANVISYMEWEGKTQDINKFNEIISSYKNKMNLIDGHLDSVTSSLQRARELVVQAANGTLRQEDRVYIAIEIDQIIRQLVSDANSEYRGMPLFGGTSVVKTPYRIKENYHPDSLHSLVTEVEYFGNAQDRVMDIGRYDRISAIAPGSNIFQTMTTIIEGKRDVSGYIASQDAKIAIEGVDIFILSGDSLESIAQKINDAQLSMKASINTLEDGASYFCLTSISPRQPWLQDMAGGTILEDLGIINNSIEGPRNYSTEAIVQKTSIFDTLLKVKNDLLSDDILKIGGEDLSYLDQSMTNILRYRAYTGALTERLEKTFARNTTEALFLKDSASLMINTDYTASITELKMAEFAHQTALSIGAKLMPVTLMDFLR